MRSVSEFLAGSDGTVAIEYGLMAGLVGVAIWVSLSRAGAGVESIFTDVVHVVRGAI